MKIYGVILFLLGILALFTASVFVGGFWIILGMSFVRMS